MPNFLPALLAGGASASLKRWKNPSKKHWFQVQKIRICTFEFLDFAFAADFLFSFFIHFFKMYLCSS